jgi:hypothetical protein
VKRIESIEPHKLIPFANMTDEKLVEVIAYIAAVENVEEAKAIEMFDNALRNRNWARQRLSKGGAQ